MNALAFGVNGKAVQVQFLNLCIGDSAGVLDLAKEYSHAADLPEAGAGSPLFDDVLHPVYMQFQQLKEILLI